MNTGELYARIHFYYTLIYYCIINIFSNIQDEKEIEVLQMLRYYMLLVWRMQ